MPKEKKRKLSHEPSEPYLHGATVDTSKPTAVFKPRGGRLHTLSVALPGSIIANAKSHDQKTFLAGTIARALAVFCVDEVIVFDDEPPKQQPHQHQNDFAPTPSTLPAKNDAENGDLDDSIQYTAFSHPSHFLAHILSYLETPPYLRKALFPMHPNLRTAGTLPSLDMPHHLRAAEWCEYREGVTIPDPPSSSSAVGTWVDVGLAQKRYLTDLRIPPHTRVTVKLTSKNDTGGEPVAPTTPRESGGLFLGYTIRRCPSLSSVFTESPFDNGYDLSFGMSERGEPLSTALHRMSLPPTSSTATPFSHMLVVFGGVGGLEAAARIDADLARKGIFEVNVRDLFDYWVDVCPGQGSRTIRTEEALWIGLMGVRGVVESRRSRG